MKAAGVIVEFNPLHYGHVEHLQETLRLTGREHIVAVMSGNFVQRGEPALCDKWRRTRMALLAGVDIVIELPVMYVVTGADYFARAAVKLLAATGIVDSLCFGSESGDLAQIKEAGRILAHEPDEYRTALHRGLDDGMSFAAARGAALGAILEKSPEGLLTKPNNGLGMEYCKALWQMGWPMEAFTSHRAAGGPSATAVRRAVWEGSLPPQAFQKEALPQYVMKILQEAAYTRELVRLEDYSDIFRYLIYTTSPDMKEGLENRFRRFAKEHRSITDLLDAVKTKRYTYTRLQRAVLGVILGISSPHMAAYENAGGPQYIRVLGFRQTAAALLGEMTRKACLPVITHSKAIKTMEQMNGLGAAMLDKEFEAGDVYCMAYGRSSGYRHERGMPVVIM